MPPKEPTRAQLSSRLTYDQKTPAFLRRLQNKVAGVQEDEDEDVEYERDDYGNEYEYAAGNSDRPPIPKRPAIPQRPSDDPGSGDEDDADEAPQVVVLKKGKHLEQWEVDNEKRKARGLPPLPRPESPESADATKQPQETGTTSRQKGQQNKKPETGLSFSSGSSAPSARKKRKLGSAGEPDDGGSTAGQKKKSKKKAPQVSLSFADDAS